MHSVAGLQIWMGRSRTHQRCQKRAFPFLGLFYGVVSAFPQVHRGYLNDLFVYAVGDVFADDVTPQGVHTITGNDSS